MWPGRSKPFRFFLCALLSISLTALRASAQDSEAYKQAQIAIENGDWDAALSMTAQILQRNPYDPNALLLKGLALTGEHDLQTADTTFEQALRIQPGLVFARKYLAINQLALKQTDQAEKNFNILLKETPQDPEIQMYLGELAFRRKDCRSAGTYLGALKSQWASHPRLPVMMAECDFELGKPADAVALLGNVDLTKLNPVWQFHAGSLLAAHQEFAAAIPFFEAARAGYPQPYDVAFNLGLCYTETKKFSPAIAVLSELRDHGSKTAEVDSLLAEAYEGNKQTKEAIDLLREATQLEPKDEQNYIELATLCADHNALDLALRVIQVGLHYLPDSDALLVQEGIINAMAGRYQEAETEFLAASHDDSVRGPALAGLGLTYIQKGDTQQAVATLRQRIKQEPGNASLQYLFGEALIRMGVGPGEPDFTAAVNALEKSVQLDPRFVHSRIDLAKLYIRAGRNTEGIRELRAAIELDPTKVQPFALLASTLKKEGKSEEAAPLFARIRELNERDRKSERPVTLYGTESGSAGSEVTTR
ncbi:MAG: tetratricopeptide repeat protein [Acidobacteriaceae bacterium]|nr:tetratricopeptide repeat protein [Acidobacteriaceae bacterium]